MIEDFSNKISYKHLQLVRINRTIPLHNGNYRNGRVVVNWGIDALIESSQKHHHRMIFKIDNAAGWIQHSQCLQVMNESIRCAQLE